LSRVPLYNRPSFLGGEDGENEVRVLCFPGQRFGFVQGEAKKLFLGLKDPAKFTEDGAFGLLDLGKDSAAGDKTNVGGGWPGCVLRDWRYHMAVFFQF